MRGLGCVILQQLSGINVVNSYAQNIFELAGESILSTSEATIVVGVILLASAGVGVTLTHRFGIRRMMAVSAAGMMVFLVSIETVPWTVVDDPVINHKVGCSTEFASAPTAWSFLDGKVKILCEYKATPKYLYYLLKEVTNWK